MTQKKRPIEITLLAWFTILALCFTLAAFAFLHLVVMQEPYLSSPEVRAAQEEFTRVLEEEFPFLRYSELILAASGSLALIAAVGLLYARNWARLLYIFQNVGGLLFNLVVGGVVLAAIGLPFSLVHLLILLSPRANAYFSGRRTLRPDDS